MPEIRETRREFLSGVVAGIAGLVVPGFLFGCGRSKPADAQAHLPKPAAGAARMVSPSNAPAPRGLGIVGCLPTNVGRDKYGDTTLSWGVEVMTVTPGSVAAVAGLEPGDVIRFLDGKTVKEPRTLAEKLARASGSFRLTALKGGKKENRQTITVEGFKPRAFLGVVTSDTPIQTIRYNNPEDPNKWVHDKGMAPCIQRFAEENVLPPGILREGDFILGISQKRKLTLFGSTRELEEYLACKLKPGTMAIIFTYSSEKVGPHRFIPPRSQNPFANSPVGASYYF